jgi:hypothetical protein
LLGLRAADMEPTSLLEAAAFEFTFFLMLMVKMMVSDAAIDFYVVVLLPMQYPGFTDKWLKI